MCHVKRQIQIPEVITLESTAFLALLDFVKQHIDNSNSNTKLPPNKAYFEDWVDVQIRDAAA